MPGSGGKHLYLSIWEAEAGGTPKFEASPDNRASSRAAIKKPSQKKTNKKRKRRYEVTRLIQILELKQLGRVGL